MWLSISSCGKDYFFGMEVVSAIMYYRYTVTLLASYTTPGNISVKNIRAAFLWLFTSIFNRNEKYVIITGVDAPMRSESFLQDWILSSSNCNYVGSILNTQMFNTFLQERVEKSCLFDELIISKNNRVVPGDALLETRKGTNADSIDSIMQLEWDYQSW